MALDEAEAAIARAGLGIAHSGLVASLGHLFNDAGAFAETFFGGKAAAKKARDDLKADLQTLGDRGKRLKDGVVTPLTDAKAALDKMLEALKRSDAGGPVDAAKRLLDCVKALDKAVKGFAAVAAETDNKTPPTIDDKIEADIAGAFEPIVRPIHDAFATAGATASKGLDELCEAAFGIGASGGKKASVALAELIAWDPKTLRLSSFIQGPSLGVVWNGLLTFEKVGIELFAEANYLEPAKPGQPAPGPAGRAGIRIKGDMAAGLRGAEVMKGIIPGEAATTDKTSVAVTLATIGGLTFGEGEDQRIALPLRAKLPGVELREFALVKPKADNTETSSRLDVSGVVAAKIGGVLAVVAQGVGVTARSGTGGSGTKPRVPDGLGFRLSAGPVKGGGYLQHRVAEDDFGGVVQLAVGPVDVTAMALFTASPAFSFVAVMGVKFTPKIDLSFGFTLNGVGGIAAYNRTLSIEKLTASLKDGIVSNLLFPDDPVPVAPKLLGQLGGLFPVKPGAFVLGPMFALGWGSQTGIVQARIGVVVSPPDPHVTVLGSATVVVPPDVPGVPPLPKYVDLKLDLMAVIGADQLYLRAALAQSKLAGMPVSGDLGVFIRWSGKPNFAISAGGFFPGYPAPPELADLRRLSIAIKSPVKAVKLSATGYFALTSNSVQIGGQVDLDAKVGPVHGTGYFGLDALFQWSPSLHFAIDVRAGIKLSAHDFDIAGVEFHGHLEGTAPWKLSGHAKVEVLWWDINFPLGPYSWGDDPVVPAPVSALDAVVAALNEPGAWSARTAKGRQVQLRPPEATPPPLIAGNSIISAKQTRVPLETPIDRVGSAKSAERRVWVSEPTIGTGAAATSQPRAQFAMSQFQDLSNDEQLARPAFETLPAGVDFTATAEITPVGAVDVAVMWETRFPKMPGQSVGKGVWALSPIALSLVRDTPAAKVRRTRNPYARPVPPPVTASEAPRRRIAEIGRVTAGPARLTAAEATRTLAEAGGAAAGLQIVTEGTFA